MNFFRYGGGKQNSGNTCYYYNAPGSLYEEQGHAEVTQVGIESEAAEKQFGMFAETYFSQFKKTPFGMIRQVRRAPVLQHVPLRTQQQAHYKPSRRIPDVTLPIACASAIPHAGSCPTTL